MRDSEQISTEFIQKFLMGKLKKFRPKFVVESQIKIRNEKGGGARKTNIGH